MKQSTQEAKELLEKVKQTLSIFNKFSDAKESEVSFRHDAIRGILSMVMNDISGMYQEWRKED